MTNRGGSLLDERGEPVHVGVGPGDDEVVLVLDAEVRGQVGHHLLVALDGDDGDDEGGVTFSVTIENGETVVTMRGDRDTAVIVRSEMGERIYLPPEDFRDDLDEDGGGPGQSSYQSRGESPYEGIDNAGPYDGVAPSNSPYEASGGGTAATGDAEGARAGGAGGGTTGGSGPAATLGVQSTDDGFRIHHPAPVTDVRLLR